MIAAFGEMHLFEVYFYRKTHLSQIDIKLAASTHRVEAANFIALC